MKKSFSIFIVLVLWLSCTKNMDVAENMNDELELIKKPNILLVIADDLGIDAMPGYSLGSVKPHMPNLELLMNEGIRFNNVWSYGVCTPARASILTGKYGFRTQVTRVGQTLSTSEMSLQKFLDVSNSGYSHAVIGKWHLSSQVNHPLSMGIGTFSGVIGGGLRSYWNWDLVENGQTHNSTVYNTTKLTDLAIDWIIDQDQPWFLWLAYNAPHTPFHLPESDLHYEDTLPSDDMSIEANPLPYYMAMLEAMDTEMGRLLDALSAEDLENTVIIFIGDNGTPNNVVQDFSRRHAKNSIYEGGIRVPMVISGKNVNRKGRYEEALLNTTDLYATIASIAGVNVSDINDSKNFESLLGSPNLKVRDYAYAEWDNGAGDLDCAIRDEIYKYITFANGDEAFYNLKSDPLETENLLEVPQSPLTQAEATALANLKNELGKLKL
ncbi:sulfatase-like hydrolase/transferase [Aestuariivivens sediminis]|uniref:sulfatase-like hydrolase/transferase n=1 Tax=Aestuariivivens sediminis TaxID=2913557 RepID=UPI001F5720D4|nr:sulfatase-like hydrolase/transferase [Aestuariivivens sediminis]